MKHTQVILYQDFKLKIASENLSSDFVIGAVQDIFLNELSHFEASHLKGKSNKVILGFSNLQNCEEYLFKIDALMETFEESNSDHCFCNLSFVHINQNGLLDKVLLQIIKDASEELKLQSGLFTLNRIDFLKHIQDFSNSIGQYYKFKAQEQLFVDSEINDLVESEEAQKPYRALIPKLFFALLSLVIIFQAVKHSGVLLGTEYDQLKYAKIETAIETKDDFLLHQYILKQSNKGVDLTLASFMDLLILRSLNPLDAKNSSEYILLRERVLSLEGRFRDYKNIILYANILGLKDKSIESRVSHYEVNSILSKVSNSTQAYIILRLSLKIDMDSYYLLEECKKVDLSEQQFTEIFRELFQNSLRESLSGKIPYYIGLIAKSEELDLQQQLIKNLSIDDLQIRRNSYLLLVKLKVLEPYQFSKFLQYEISRFVDYEGLINLLTANYLQENRSDLIVFLERSEKKLKYKKAHHKIYLLIQKKLKALY
ncbi:hypothetical protein MJH12_05565 [bacterium]|nr:hypothetical protein [bacterium]